ncbi:hypothetical protein [Paraburkholderia strydomiana]|uniref:hypothetical protein n=1 Tax=Paraburkholderia strydomiana TaxID=1245417 RepID=UPI0038B73A30
MKGRIAGASEHRHPGRSAGLPVMAAVADTPLRPLPSNDEQTTNKRRTNDEQTTNKRRSRVAGFL